jgi:hypothetical protein
MCVRMDFAKWAAKAEPRFDASFEIAFASPAHESGLTIKIVLAAIGGPRVRAARKNKRAGLRPGLELTPGPRREVV